MAEVSFDTLEALARLGVPSETDASIVSGFKRITVVQGPVKVERNFYQQGDGDDFAASDTFVSGLVRPFAVSAQFTNIDAGGATAHPTAELEGVESDTNFKRVTVHDADGINDAGILVTVYGY